jgi:RNA polymerase primary sigma factor
MSAPSPLTLEQITPDTQTYLEENLRKAIQELEPIPEQVASKIDSLFFEFAKDQTNIKLRNQIVLKNQALVAYIINKYYSGKKELKERREDLLQEGIIGLLSAIDGYKPDLGFRFSTYASWWIRQAVNAYLQTMSPVIHIPSHVRTAQNKVARTMASMDCSFEEAAQKTASENGYTDRMISSVSAAMLARNVLSLDGPVRGHNSSDGAMNDSTLGESMPDPDSIESDAEGNIDKNLLLEAIKESFKQLSIKERCILLLRFGVINEEEVGSMIRNSYEE